MSIHRMKNTFTAKNIQEKKNKIPEKLSHKIWWNKEWKKGKPDGIATERANIYKAYLHRVNSYTCVYVYTWEQIENDKRVNEKEK